MTKKNLPLGQAYVDGNKAYTKSNDHLLSKSIEPAYPIKGYWPVDSAIKHDYNYDNASLNEKMINAWQREQEKSQIKIKNGEIVIYQGNYVENTIKVKSPDIKKMTITIGDTEFVSKEKLNDTEEKLQRALDTIKELRNIFSQTR